MSVEAEIPKGWYRLKNGSAVKRGDRIWLDLKEKFGLTLKRKADTEDPVSHDEIIIRKIPMEKVVRCNPPAKPGSGEEGGR